VVLAAAECGGELELLNETTESVTGCPAAVWSRPCTTASPAGVRDSPPVGDR